MNELNEFFTTFHNPPGETIKEKQHNVFNLFRQHEAVLKNPTTLTELTTNLKATNHLESIFLIDFLIYFRRYDELHHHFLKGNEIAVKKLAKQPWFYEKAFHGINIEILVTNMFPTISYSVKIQVLKKLPMDSSTADGMFDLILSTYGIGLATIVLAKCTSEKILQTFVNYPVRLSYTQLKLIHKKNPQLLLAYIQHRVKHEGNAQFLNCNAIVKYIAHKSPEIFLQIFQDYDFELQGFIGYRTTKQLITRQRDNILKDLSRFLGIFNSAICVKMFHPILLPYFFEQCTRRYQQNWKFLLKHYPKKQQYHIFSTAYDLYHYKKLEQDLGNWSRDVLKLGPDTEKRQELAKKILEKEQSSDWVYAFFPPEMVLEEFLSNINNISTEERARYVQLATESCLINEDPECFLKVLQLMCGRLKNDDFKVRTSFFSALAMDNKLDILKEEHWKLVVEIVAKAETQKKYIHNDQPFRIAHAKFLIENKLSLKDAVKCTRWPYILNSAQERDFKVLIPLFNELVKMGHPKPNMSTDEAAEYDCMLAAVYKKYSKKYNMSPVCDQPRILQSVKKVLEEENLYIDPNCVLGIDYISQAGKDQELKNIYLKACSEISGFLWFLKNEPKALKNNYESFLNRFTDIRGHWKPFWREIKKYSYLQLDQLTIDFCKTKLNGKVKRGHVQALAFSSNFETYYAIMAQVGLSSKNMLIKHMHLVNSPSQVLPVVLTCVNQHTKSTLPPLNSCIYKVAEKEVKNVLCTLKETHKKHISACTLVCDFQTSYSYLQDSLLVATLKYFSANPSDYLWELVEIKIRKAEVDSLKFALKFTLPLKYRSNFLNLVWEHSNDDLIKELLEKFDENTVKCLDPEFACKVLESTIFTVEDSEEALANILLHLPGESKFLIFCNSLKLLKKHQKLTKFVEALLKKYMRAKKVNSAFVPNLLKAFSQAFTPTAAFKEFVLISCMELKNNSVETCAGILLNLNQQFEALYSTYAVPLLAASIKSDIFKFLFKTPDEIVKLCYSLLKQKKTMNDYCLILALLPDQEPATAECHPLYEEILREVRGISQNIVQLQMNLYLKTGFQDTEDFKWNKKSICEAK